MTSIREQVYVYVKKKYRAKPEYLWSRFPGYAVFRHADNRKWFGLIMDVPYEKLDLPGEGLADILNIKVEDPFYADMLVQQEGFLRGYHLTKGNWISILLDGTVPLEQVCRMIDEGYLATASKKEKQKNRPPKEWLVPANPAYYDIEHAFDEQKEIDWKQGKGIRKGDTVYLYAAAPVSAILYKCKVTQTDIPFSYEDKNLTISALMKVKLQKRYAPKKFPFSVLKETYGIGAVRGPRGIPGALSAALKK